MWWLRNSLSTVSLDWHATDPPNRIQHSLHFQNHWVPCLRASTFSGNSISPTVNDLWERLTGPMDSSKTSLLSTTFIEFRFSRAFLFIIALIHPLATPCFPTGLSHFEFLYRRSFLLNHHFVVQKPHWSSTYLSSSLLTFWELSPCFNASEPNFAWIHPTLSRGPGNPKLLSPKSLEPYTMTLTTPKDHGTSVLLPPVQVQLGTYPG